jgi:hypothetical protein
LYPHRIRLRGPWDYELTGDAPRKGRVVLPCRWREEDLGDCHGRVLLRRRFGWPGRLDSHERVWLILRDAAGVAEVTLNGIPLSQGAPGKDFEFEVIDHLRVRNELNVLVDAAAAGDHSWGDVALEVRCLAYLRDVKFAATLDGSEMEVRAAGNLVGECDRRLELYLLLENATVAYQTIESHPDGKPFELVSERVPARPGKTLSVRVELMNGSVVWYVAEETITAPAGTP